MAEIISIAMAATPWIMLFMIIVARLSFIMFFMPGIGEQVVPVQLRLFLLLAIAAAFSTLSNIAVRPVTLVADYAAMMVSEIILGMFLGVSLRAGIWMLSIAGAAIAQSIGLSQLLGVAIEHEAQTLTANLLTMAGVAVLLSADFHVNVIAALASLYEAIPVGALLSLEWAFFFESLLSAFKFALLLAWPFVAINLLYNICLGFINKALPQLMVSFVGAPFLIGAGTLFLAFSVAGLLVMWKEQALSLMSWL